MGEKSYALISAMSFNASEAFHINLQNERVIDSPAWTL